MTREELLAIFIDTEPTARSPYGLYDYPPMWKVAEKDGMELFARPGATMTRVNFAYAEVPGVHWQARQGEKWHDQGRQGTFETFFEYCADWFPAASDVQAPSESPVP